MHQADFVLLDVPMSGRALDADAGIIFRRGEEHSVRDSLGLGLYIVRQIVSAHGGRVEVRSDRESGTTFVVRLPFAAQASPAHELAG